MTRHPLPHRLAKSSAALVLLYGLTAYLALPDLWWLRDRGNIGRPGSMVTTTVDGIPGDPVNVGFVGATPELVGAFAKAKWHAADAITFRSSLEIGVSVLFDRPYGDAPVSTLLLDGRRQDLAFEMPVGASADRRHHVRLWLMPEPAPDGRALWYGAASFDRGVGISHDTGAITHHIGSDVDAERDFLMASLKASLASTYDIPGRGPTDAGRNGGGDPYVTDGLTLVGVLVPAAGP